MPTWGALLQELNRLTAGAQVAPPVPGAPSPHDILRRKYLKQVHDLTGRATIMYATGWLEQNRPEVAGTAYTVNLGDVQGFMEACSGVSERELDLIITSPGGSPDAAESIMAYLRTQFDQIRVFVPVAAMSAATMMSLAADEIVMGSHSQLGPIDPQFTISTPEGPRSAPGQAILDQFELAKKECQDPANIAGWLPLLRGLLPGLIAQCEHQRELAKTNAAAALERYMFAGQDDAAGRAAAAAEWFANFSSFRSHGRRVSREDARGQGLTVTDLEDDPQLQDAVLSAHHATRLTLSGTGATKIIENHNGRAFIEITQAQLIQVTGPPNPGTGGPFGLPAAPSPRGPRGGPSGNPAKRGR